MSALHIILLHISGSTNPLGVCARIDTIKFYPKFLVKDILGFTLIIGYLSFNCFWYPTLLFHPDNFIKANPMVTPPHIVPEFYFLPFYAILRAIPNKLVGVLAMFSAILILLLLPFLGRYHTKSSKLLKLAQFFFWCFIINFLLLG
jgi:ubiquinol-cytochrome c reductase cytochrome b subunit